MNVCVLGGDGYLGWPSCMHFSSLGDAVLTVDNGAKRRLEAQLAVKPLVAVEPLAVRADTWKTLTGRTIDVIDGDIAADPAIMQRVCRDFRPDVIIHFAEQPSAPYSMIDVESATYTQFNNVIGTLNVMFAMHEYAPDAHLVKLGTMGEYGTPNFDIEEGWLEVTHNGRTDRVLFPKRPPSFYHLSKVHDSANLEFGCRIWNMCVTDLNQGIVYGFETDETALDTSLRTSFHYDDVFGTALNRFVVQAVAGIPLTVYGEGGQTRGWLNIKDTLRCVELAARNPASPGTFRVFNQFTEQFTVLELAERVKNVADRLGIQTSIQHVANPRVEMERHYFNAKHSALMDLGLQPCLLDDTVIARMIGLAMEHAATVELRTIMPRLDWKHGFIEAKTPVSAQPAASAAAEPVAV